MRALTLTASLFLLAAALAGCVTPVEPNVNSATVPGELTDAPGFSDTHVYPGEYNLEDDWARPLVEGALGILDPQIAAMESEVDGANIEVGYFLPDVPEGQQVPVIVFASPYLFQGMTEEGMKQEYVYDWLVKNYVPHGYAVAYVPIRGTSDNGGCSDLMGPKERADLDQAITWLGTQDWSNGNVAMLGVSYDGSTPWEVASMGNPHLKTIVPISGVNDPYRLMFKNGTNEFRGPLILNALYYEYGFLSYNAVQNGRSPFHMLEGAACPEAWEGLAASVHSGATGERDPMGYWAERNMRPLVEENYEGSIFLVHGLQDWNVDPSHAYPWVNQLEDQGFTVKHLLGQWNHAFPDRAWINGEEVKPRMDWAEILLHWFDHWLKEKPDVDLGPKVQVQDNTGAWRSEDAWPPSDAVETTFYLAPGGELATEPADAEGKEAVAPNARTWVSAFGQRVDVDQCPACPTFATEAFDEDFRFAGVPKAHVTVTPTGPGGHVTAFLYVVEDGDRERVGWGQMDLRFAAGGETAQDVTPGEPIVAKMVLEPLDVVVPAGAHLELEFHQGAYGDHVSSAPTYPVELHTGGDASTLKVMSFERGADAFFEPPAVLE